MTSATLAKQTEIKFLNPKKCLPVWFDSNNKIQFQLPSELLGLREGKKLLIQRINVYVPVHHLFKGKTGCKGYTAAFQQDISKVFNFLPNLPDNVQFLQVIKKFKDKHGDIGEKSFVIRKKKVLDALFWIQKYNRHYSDVTVDATRLDWIKKDETKLLNTKNKQVYYTDVEYAEGYNDADFSRLMLSMEFRKKIMDLLPLK